MGLFDFLKGKKKDTAPLPEAAAREEAAEGKIQYERKLSAREVTADARVIQAIVEKMVAEDPFQNFYQGQSDDQIVRRVYEYEEITTMNVGMAAEGKNWHLSIEGILLGAIPPAIVEELGPFQGKHVLTAYAYVTGGRYKEYAQGEVREGRDPYDLAIYLQYA